MYYRIKNSEAKPGVLNLTARTAILDGFKILDIDQLILELIFRFGVILV